MPFVQFTLSDFAKVDTPGEDTIMARKVVDLSGNQQILRICAAAPTSFNQPGNNTIATNAPFLLSVAAVGSNERYYGDTRCKDSIDIVIPGSGMNQLDVVVYWKGAYNDTGPPNYYPVFGLSTTFDVSIHEQGVT